MTISALNLPDGPYALKARWVVPVDAEPIAEGVVSVEQGRIAAVGSADKSRQVVDLGNVAILPGLVNAHAHLEFSDLEQPLGFAGIDFPAWIREIVARRRQFGEDADSIQRQKYEAVKGGAYECLRHGTTTLGEITTSPITDGIVPDAPLQCTMFHELIGLSQQRADAALHDAKTWLETFQGEKPVGQPALSPHAPYSVSTELLGKTISLSSEMRIPLAMHLAESVEELELLSSHSGPFVEMFTQSGFWEPSAIPRGLRPLDFIRQLARAHRTLVIHGNYLMSDEISLLAKYSDHMSVVYCPRTHAYFDHGRYPLVEMLAQGVNVALGTDSRASNPNLSLWEEMLFVVEHYPALTREKVVELGTIRGAAALGLDRETGSLARGKKADLCVIGLADRQADPFRMLFHPDSKPIATVLHGKEMHAT